MAIKAVIPAAGLGTRFHPVTTVVPKEMFPILGRPIIEVVLDELAEAGIEQSIFVIREEKKMIADYLRNRSTFVYQESPKGLGDAVLQAEESVGNQPFAVVLPDVICDEGQSLIRTMIEVHQRFGGSVIALHEVDPTETHAYGIARIEGEIENDVVRMIGSVEKPSPENAPSLLAVTGRYVLPPEIFSILRTLPPGAKGEIQLTDAIDILAAQPEIAGPVHGVIYRGEGKDTGNKLGYVKALIQYSLRDGEIGGELEKWLSARE